MVTDRLLQTILVSWYITSILLIIDVNASSSEIQGAVHELQTNFGSSVLSYRVRRTSVVSKKDIKTILKKIIYQSNIPNTKL